MRGASPVTCTLPPLRFDCGSDDALSEPNRALRHELERFGIAPAYREFPGGHAWDYWQGHLADSLRFFASALKGAVRERAEACGRSFSLCNRRALDAGFARRARAGERWSCVEGLDEGWAQPSKRSCCRNQNSACRHSAALCPWRLTCQTCGSLSAFKDAWRS